MNDYLITFYITKLNRHTNNQELSNDYFINQITKELGDCTILRAKQCSYTSNSKKQLNEPAYKVEYVLNDTYEYVNKLAIEVSKKFIKLFDIDTVLFTIQELKTYEVVF